MDITKPGQGPGKSEEYFTQPPVVPASEGVTPPEVNPLPPKALGETSIPTGVDQLPADEVPAQIPGEEVSAPLPGGPLTQEENSSTKAGSAPNSGVPEGPVLTDTPAPEGAAAPIEASQPQETVIEPDQTPATTLPQEGIDPAKHGTPESLERAVGSPTEPAAGAPTESAQAPVAGSVHEPGVVAEGTPPGQAQEVPPAPATEPVKDTAPVSPVIGPEVSKNEKSPEEMRVLVESLNGLLRSLGEEMGRSGEIVASLEKSQREIEEKKQGILGVVSQLEDITNPEDKGGESN